MSSYYVSFASLEDQRLHPVSREGRASPLRRLPDSYMVAQSYGEVRICPPVVTRAPPPPKGACHAPLHGLPALFCAGFPRYWATFFVILVPILCRFSGGFGTGAQIQAESVIDRFVL